MNKRAELATISIILIVAAIIGGIFIADKIGLFSSFTPSIGQPAGASSLVNLVYYPATNTPTTCQLSASSSTRKCAQSTNLCSSLDPIRFAECAVCGSGSAPCSARPSDCGLWDPGGIPIKDAGIYACSNGDIVTKYCGSFGNTLVEDCPSTQICEFRTNYQVPEGFDNVVKCTGNYKPDQKLCVGNTLYSTSADGGSISSQVCGYLCSNQACVNCQDGLKKCNSMTSVDICLGGQWTHWTDPAGTCIGEQQCVSGVCTSDFVVGQRRCNGNQPQIFTSSQVWANEGDACDLSCIQDSATAVHCQKECDPTGYYCAGGYLRNCLSTDRDNEIQNVGACVSGSCSADGLKCLPTRQLGSKYCSSGNVFVASSSGNIYDLNGGVTGIIFGEPCDSTCVPVGDNNAECRLEAGCAGHLGQSICTDTITKAVCSDNGQQYTSIEDCSTLYANGFCKDGFCSPPEPDCTGTKVCTSGGIIRACTSGVLGNTLDSCNDLGCTSDTYGNVKCTDECSAIDTYTCFGFNSILCSKNSTNSQLQKITIKCGLEGCGANGRCSVTGIPNNFTCIGEAIYPTDSYGGALPNPIAICGASDNSYCSETISQCVFCERDQPICTETTLAQCDNPFTGSLKNIQSCELGCSLSPIYCDRLSATISPTQNFFADEDMIITGSLKGSSSLNPVKTTYIARLYSLSQPSTVLDTQSGSSDVNGHLSISFGRGKPLGDYIIRIELDKLGKTFNVSSKVTNDYRVRISGPDVVQKIPGLSAVTEIEALDANGNEPDSVIVSTLPTGITATATKKTSGKWAINLSGEPGIYEIGFTPVKDSIELAEQFKTISLIKAKLTGSVNLPASTKKGKSTYTLTITGPISAEGATAGIKPDNITATMSKSSATAITLLDSGSGKYTFEYDFTEIGTYTFNVAANKNGYDPATLSQQVQVSDSGDVAPPSSSTRTDTSGTDTGTTGGEKPSYRIYIIIAVLLIGGYLIFKKK